MAREVHPQHHETTTRNGGGGHTGVFAVLVVVLLIVVAAILYFGGFLGAGGVDGTDLEADIQVEAPSNPTESN